jgi:ElaB protein
MEQRFTGMKESMAKAQELYEQGIEKGRELAKTASEKSGEAFDIADEWMHTNPWLALGVAAGIGLFLGLILGSGGRERNTRD